MPEKQFITDPPPPVKVEGRARLLTDIALSDYLQCSTGYINREVKSGRLKAIQLASREYRFRWSDVDQWLKSLEGLVP